MANFEYSNRNKWTISRGDPEYSGRRKPKFPESLQVFAITLAITQLDQFRRKCHITANQ